MVLLHPLRRILPVLLPHVIIRIAEDDLVLRASYGGALWSDERRPTLLFNRHAIIPREITAIRIHVTEIPQRLQQEPQLCDLMDLRASEVKRDDRSPFHVDSGM